MQKKTFRRGIHPLHRSHEGKLQTRDLPIKDYVSDTVIISMAMNIGAPAKPIVKKGDHVDIGQVIGEAQGFMSVPVHASVSGEVTAVDLVQYSQHIGGITRASTVLAELLDSTDFANANPYLYQFASLAAFQRLGYIVDEILEDQEQADALYQCLRDAELHFRWAALSRQKPADNTMPSSSRWKVIVNTNIEVDDL